MAERKPEWSEAGDLIITAVKTVIAYGACVRLDEFEGRFLLHSVTKAKGQGTFRREK
jgi:translation initiation factor 2 alpha subunit (eIF-2alpha)